MTVIEIQTSCGQCGKVMIERASYHHTCLTSTCMSTRLRTKWSQWLPALA